MMLGMCTNLVRTTSMHMPAFVQVHISTLEAAMYQSFQQLPLKASRECASSRAPCRLLAHSLVNCVTSILASEHTTRRCEITGRHSLRLTLSAISSSAFVLCITHCRSTIHCYKSESNASRYLVCLLGRFLLHK